MASLMLADPAHAMNGLPKLPRAAEPTMAVHHQGRRNRHAGPRTDFIIAARRKEEENRTRMREQTQYYAKTSHQSHFEEFTNAAIQRNRFFRRFEELKVQEEDKVEARRARLRQLLADDEERYKKDLESKVVTRESRIEAMRARMNELKEKREVERKKVVEDKLLQQWRNECDELRAIESQLLEKEVASARDEQLIELREKRVLAVQEKQYYDQLWEQDRQRKIEREENDRARRKAMNEETTATLHEQIYMLKQQAKEEQRLKEEEAALMRQENELRILEEERAHARKIADQRVVRLELDAFNKSKIQQRQRAIQESLDMDMKIVNAFFRMDEQEKENKSRRKEELRKEVLLYMEHLREQKRIEKEREAEIERLYADESEKLWQQRSEKWQKEQRARDRLMQEVLAGRQEQLQHSINLNRVRQEEALREKHLLEQQIAAARTQEEHDREEHLQVAQEYKNALTQQMQVVEGRKRLERERAEEETLLAQEEDVRYKELLRLEMERASQLPRVRAFRAANRNTAAVNSTPMVATVVGSGPRRRQRDELVRELQGGLMVVGSVGSPGSGGATVVKRQTGI
ncbi:tumor suppressor, Mitostatin-domain-containing protein [Phlyctochytrium arcticum]|nr:tumor suppressor, Mitostatin-domain-containing protein [Phlyctochytrium arcticum]